MTADDVNAALIGTAKQSLFAAPNDEGHDDYYGFGLVQPGPALTFFDEPLPVEPPPPGGCACGTSAPDGALAALCAFLVLRRFRSRALRSSAA
jgi:hypothetical protein